MPWCKCPDACAEDQHTTVAAALRQVFPQPDTETAHNTRRHVADQPRARWPKRATLTDDDEHDTLAPMAFPFPHRAKVHIANPLGWFNKEVKRQARTCPGRRELD